MGKQAKANKREEAIKARAQRIAEAVLRYRLREEALSDEEQEELVQAVYKDQLARLRAEAGK
jgi:hypothetical protein